MEGLISKVMDIVRDRELLVPRDAAEADGADDDATAVREGMMLRGVECWEGAGGYLRGCLWGAFKVVASFPCGVASLVIFYWYFHGSFSFELLACLPLVLSLSRCTGLSPLCLQIPNPRLYL